MHHQEERLWEVKQWSPRRKCLNFIKFSQNNYVMKCMLIASTFALVNADRFPSSLTKLNRLSKLWAVIQLCYDSWGCYSLGRKNSEFPPPLKQHYSCILYFFPLLLQTIKYFSLIFDVSFRFVPFVCSLLFLQSVLSDIGFLQDRMHQNRSPKEFSFQTKRMLLTSSLNLLALWTKKFLTTARNEIFPVFFFPTPWLFDDRCNPN